MRDSEWIFSLSIASLLGVMWIVAHFSSFPIKTQSPQLWIEPATVSVDIRGEVKKPGIYPVSLGTSFKEVLFKASPLRFADLDSIDLEAPIEKDCQIVIEKLLFLTVFVQGAIANAPLEIKVPLGTKVCELRPLLELLPEADLSSFKSRRMAKHKEVIFVPVKPSLEENISPK